MHNVQYALRNFHNMKIDKKTLFLEERDICLRPLNKEDITDEYINGLNDPEVNKYLVNVRFEVQTLKTIGEYVQFNMDNPCSILFGVFLKNDQRSFIGTVHVSGIDFYHFIASIGLCLFAKRAWGKGYAIQSLKVVREYLFVKLGLHYLEGAVYTENINSVKLFENAGFLEKCRIDNKFRHVDSFKEVIYFGVINPSFDISLLKQNNLYDGLIKA